LLDEVERVSDHVALIDRGRIVLGGSLESIKALHHRLTLRFDEPLARPPTLLGSSRWEGFGREWTTVCPGSIEEIRARAAGFGAQVVEDQSPTLEDIFVARAALPQTVGVEGP
jgi:ABC-2 type transport system ATP-binding protein